MKKLVIYYSHDGNTKFIAETIAREINADITELKTKKTMNASGLMKVGWGVRQLVSQSEPALLTMEKKPADYDLIIIGSPVWTYTFAPPIRTFLKNHSMLGKKIGLFCCHGGQTGKTLENMKKLLDGNMVIGECDFLEPLSYEKENNKKKAIVWAKKIVNE